MLCLKRPSLWREAATLIIASKCRPLWKERPNDLSCRTREQDFEILMLRRSGKLGFFPDTFVFPGGSVVDSDFDDDWLSVIPHSDVETTLQNVYPYSVMGVSKPAILARPWKSRVPNEIALRITALRETFEEAGCLLARHTDSGQIYDQNAMSVHLRSDLRTQVQNDSRQFIEIFRKLDCYPDVASLVEWSDWLTPTGSRRRFDTLFFVTFTEEHQVVSHDEHETVEHSWLTSDEFIKQRNKGEVMLPPPQLYELQRINRFPSFKYFQYFSYQRAHNYSTRRWLPIQLNCNDGLLSLLPDDYLYPHTATNCDVNDMEDESYAQLAEQWQNRTIADHIFETRGVNCLFWLSEHTSERAAHWLHAMRLYTNICSSEGHLMPIMSK